MNFTKALNRYCDGYTWIASRHPKAAKKKRIQKKWRKRFGPPMNEVVEAVLQAETFWSQIPKGDTWKAGSYLIPGADE